MEKKLPKADIEMRDYSFQPSKINIRVGGEVVWANSDAVPHTVTAEDGSFDSGDLNPGEAFSFAFKEKGSIDYFCKTHPTMRGKVIVGYPEG